MLLWNILFSFSKRSVFTFIISKPRTKFCFSFSNIGSIITNFASQIVNNFFWGTVMGSSLNFKYLPICFCCKSVSCNYMITHLTSNYMITHLTNNLIGWKSIIYKWTHEANRKSCLDFNFFADNLFSIGWLFLTIQLVMRMVIEC